MQAESKIQEAEFFLDAILECYNPITYPDIVFYFSAFLGSAISILDYLSEDYAKEFNLQIPYSSRSFKHEFNKKMKNSEDKTMKEFHNWILSARNQIEQSDEIGSLLTQKRHRITHRRFEPPSIRLRIRYKTSDHPRAKVRECIVPWFENQQTSLDKKKIGKILLQNVIEKRAILPIDDDKKIDMAEACFMLLNKIKKLVNETQEKFPINNNHK